MGDELPALMRQLTKGESMDFDYDGNSCSKGEDCAVHNRLDEKHLDQEMEHGRMITYVGDYLVLTTVNPDVEKAIGYPLVSLNYFDLPLYETCVIMVGTGSLSDLWDLTPRAQASTIRFVEKHNSWAAFENAHEMVVEAVQAGSIDLSRPVQ